METRQEYSFFSPDVNPLKIKLLTEYLVPGNCVDIGCGNGAYGETIMSRCAELLQIDLVDRRLSRAKGYPFVVMDAGRLTLPDKGYDNVVAFDIMEHLDDDGLFLRQIRRICRGRFLFSVPNANDDQIRALALTHMHHLDKTHRREYTREGIARLLESNGIRLIEIRPHYNRLVLNAARAFATGSLLSKIAAKSIYLQTRFYESVGLFRNRCIPDWFGVAEM